MAVLQENIFDIVKRANTKDFKTELRTWQSNSYAQSSTWSSMYRNGMIFKQFYLLVFHKNYATNSKPHLCKLCNKQINKFGSNMNKV